MVKPPESRKKTSQKTSSGRQARDRSIPRSQKYPAVKSHNDTKGTWMVLWYDAFVYLGVWFLNGTIICRFVPYVAVFMFNMSVRFTKKSVLCDHLSGQNTFHCDMSATHRNFMESTLPLELEVGRPACDYCFVCFSDIHFPRRVNKFASKTHVWSFQMIQMHPNPPNSHLFTHINTSHSLDPSWVTLSHQSFSSKNCCWAIGGPVHKRWPRPTPRACDASQIPWSDKLKPARRA